jgi:hypothetical protein
MIFWFALTHTGKADELTSDQINVLAARYQDEPTVQQVVAWAIAHTDLNQNLTKELSRRARFSGLAPTLKFSISRGMARDLSEQQSANGERFDTSHDDDLSLSGTLTFQLGQLIFASEEISILREKRSLLLFREDLIRTVVHLYFLRRRLQIERDANLPGHMERTLQLLENEALLNELTGGHFVEALRRCCNNKSP